MALLEFVKMSFYALATQAAWQQQQQTIHSNSGGQGDPGQTRPRQARPGPARLTRTSPQHTLNGWNFDWCQCVTQARMWLMGGGFVATADTPDTGDTGDTVDRQPQPSVRAANRALSHRSATSFSAFDKRLTNVSDFVFVSLHFMLPTQTYITHTYTRIVHVCAWVSDGYRCCYKSKRYGGS